MAESGQILQTTTDDLERVSQFVAGNSVSSMRLRQTQLKLQLLKDQKRLCDMRSNESLTKALIYNNIEFAKIQSDLAAGRDTQVDPTQSYRLSISAVNPNQEIATAKFKAYSNLFGLKQLDSEINKTNSQVMSLQARIRAEQKALVQLQKDIDNAVLNQPKSFLDSALGRVLLPSAEDLQKDKLVKSRTYNLIFLQQLSVLYLNYSTSSITTGQRGFPDEVKLPQTLINIRAKFWAHGQQFQDATGESTDINFVTGSDALNFDDPGSSQNQIILNKWVSVLRNVGKSSKITVDVAQFIKDNVVITNNTTVSEGIERRPDPTLPASNSMRVKTQSYPVTAINLGPIYIGSFTIPSITESVRKWWKKRQTQYIPLPTCPNVQVTPATATDTKEKSAQTVNDALVVAGQKSFADALAKAKALQDKVNAVPPLPEGAKDWVIQFNNLYGNSADVGQINYPIISEGTVGFIPQTSRIVTKSPSSNPNYGMTLAAGYVQKQADPTNVTAPIQRDSYTTGPSASGSGAFIVYQLWEMGP